MAIRIPRLMSLRVASGDLSRAYLRHSAHLCIQTPERNLVAGMKSLQN